MASVKSLFLSSLLATAPLVQASAAPIETDSPVSASAVATFPSGGFSDVTGYVSFEATSDGEVQVSVSVSGLPSEGYPFLYHIHESTVPSSGNCTATEGHFNPFEGNSSCASQDSVVFCEVGDLSGKWGAFNSSSYTTTYTDPYLSLNPGSQAYIGNLSIVIHFANTSRLACANLKYTTGSSSSATSNETSTSTRVSVSTAGASSNGITGFVATVLGLLFMII